MGLFAALLSGAAAASEPPPPPAPRLDDHDMRFCSRVARRAVEQFVSDKSVYAAPYVPPSLEAIRCHVVVTLYHQRRQIGAGSSGPFPLVGCVSEAAFAAARVAETRLARPLTASDVESIEIEAIGDEAPVDLKGDAARPELLERLLEPGIDGFSARCGGMFARVGPSELIAKNLTVADSFQSMVQSLPCPIESQTLWRFRTTHWYQSMLEADAGVVALRRGMTLIMPDDVTLSAVNRAIDAIVENMVYRQQPSGYLAYEFEPAAFTYGTRDDPVHQAGAAWALSAAAATTGERDLSECAARVHEKLRSRIVDLPGIPGAACVTSDDETNKLGLTAQTLAAMNVHPDRDRFRSDRSRLVRGILWLQLPTGEFVTAFPPARQLLGGDVFPGQALSALMLEYAEEPDSETLNAFDRALDFYSRAFAETPSLRQAAWLAQPFAEMAVRTARPDFARFAFTLGDWIVDRQLGSRNCDWPELFGGVRGFASQVPGIDTAAALSALASAASAAQRFDDIERLERYRQSAARAARFVMQLQFRDAESFNIPMVRDVAGGVRTTAFDNRLRLENMQYAILALMDYRSIAFPNTGGAGRPVK